jgi:hypothetical protein
MAAATKPTVAFERYKQQIDAIQTSVMAKAQLPLHEVGVLGTFPEQKALEHILMCEEGANTTA